jgi:nicotinamide riboside transporter PnuC
MRDDAVLAAMGLTGLTVFLANGYLNNYKNFVIAKTHGVTYTQASPTTNVWAWGFGLVMVTVVLTAAAGSDEVGDLAKGFAVLIAGTTVFAKGQAAVTNAKGLVAATPAGGSTVTEA